MKAQFVTHEQFIDAVRNAAIKYAAVQYKNPKGRLLLDVPAFERIARARLCYGRGVRGTRGLTEYGGWNARDENKAELVEICAASEENWVQLAITTIHELAHCATGKGHGHNKAWKDACEALGLRRHPAQYVNGDARLATIAPELRFALALMPHPTDGTPSCGADYTFKTRPCGAGIGVRGGKSRGPGSGSRLRKYVCSHGQIVRASTDTLAATCTCCNTPFILSV